MTQAINKAPRTLSWRDVAELSGYSAADLAILRSTVTPKDVQPESMLAFLAQCRANGDDPFRKGAYLIPRGGKLVPQVSIDGYRARAARTRQYAGSEDAIFRGSVEIPNGKDTMRVPEMASVTVWRLIDGHKCAFTASARFVEYYPGEKSGAMWRDKPYLMLAKCAEALALRKGFSDALGDLPDRLADEEADEAPVHRTSVREASDAYERILGEQVYRLDEPEPDPEPDPPAEHESQEPPTAPDPSAA